jgi:D-xylose transport system permease protein
MINKLTISNGNKRSLVELLASDFRALPVVVGLLILGFFFATQSDVFLSSRNLSNLLVQSTVTGIIALGLIFVLITAEIDLSVAAVSGVSSVVMSIFAVKLGYPIYFSVVLAIGFGAFIGAITGWWITFFKVPSFVVTLGVGLVLNGIQLVLLPNTGRYNLLGTGIEKIAGTYISGSWAWLTLVICIIILGGRRINRYIGKREAGLGSSISKDIAIPIMSIFFLGVVVVGILLGHKGIPMPFLIFIVLLAIAHYFTTETKFGLYIYAVGNNVEAARRAGISITKVKVASFSIAGGMAGLGGVLAASRILGVSVSSGGGVGGGALLLESIAAAVIGGVSLFGGKGRVIAALLGALIIGTVSNGLNLMGVQNEIRLIVTGMLLISAISIDRGIERLTGSTEV